MNIIKFSVKVTETVKRHQRCLLYKMCCCHINGLLNDAHERASYVYQSVKGPLSTC